MEERTLIKQGGGGYTVYLPKKWIDSKGLKEKDSVFIDEKNGMLTLRARLAKRNSGNILFDENNKHDVRTLLTHFYREGCDEIKCENVDSGILSDIINTINKYLLAFEIVEREGNTCIIGNISEPENQKYDVILRRIFLIVQESISVLYQDAKGGKFTKMHEIQDMRDQIDKFILFCRRIITKEQLEHNEALSWEMLTFLNYIQHAAYYLYKYANENKVKMKDKSLSLLFQAIEQFDLYKGAYYNKSLSSIHDINKKKESYHGKSFAKLIETSKGSETFILLQIRELHRLIQIGTSPLISMILEEQLNPVVKN